MNKDKLEDWKRWDEVMTLAEKYGFVVEDCEGTAIIANLTVQLERLGFKVKEDL